MQVLNDEDRKNLLEFARSVISAELLPDMKVEYPKSSPELERKRGCFVTLHKKGRLRGCIGTIEPVKSLISCIKDNALNSAFHDPRFPALKKEELSEIDIEISVLTVPEKLDYKDAEDLKAKLEAGNHGVILSKGWHRATFLPQVWEQLPDKEDFLTHLCQKAGMDKNCWKDGDIEIDIYKVEYFSE